jgi:hypothetical protein
MRTQNLILLIIGAVHGPDDKSHEKDKANCTGNAGNHRPMQPLRIAIRQTDNCHSRIKPGTRILNGVLLNPDGIRLELV